MYMYVYVCMCIYVYLYLCIYLCIIVYMYVFISVDKRGGSSCDKVLMTSSHSADIQTDNGDIEIALTPEITDDTHKVATDYKINYNEMSEEERYDNSNSHQNFNR